MILLDTHVIVWMLLESHRLSTKAREAIRSAQRDGGLAMASISLSELAWLAHNQRIDAKQSVDAFVSECASRVAVLPITPAIAVQAVKFPDSYPHDPQDRLIGATALVEGIELVTHDRIIKKSGLVPVIW